MKAFLLTSILVFLSCKAPERNFYLTESQVKNDTIVETGTFDTLAAFRKMPGEPKTVYVEGYYRKDSTYVAPHYRSEKTKQ